MKKKVSGRAIAIVVLSFVGGAARAADIEPGASEGREARPKPQWSTTFYAGPLSGEAGWEDVMFNPVLSKYVGAYLVAATVSRTYGRPRRGGALQLEAEGQVAYNFGAQDHWEFNAVPIVARWSRLPWSHRFDSSVAFGLGLSYATELPPVEVALEGESHQLLIYWVAEITAGPLASPWEVSLRLHHRSVGYGLFGEDGGMNAVGLGLRYTF
jgi:hypothetical protein